MLNGGCIPFCSGDWAWVGSCRSKPRSNNTILQLSGFCWDNLGELIPKETFPYSHLPWSSIISYLLPPSIKIHDILPVQFMCLTAFQHNLCPSFLWSTSWPGTHHFILHTFLHPIIVFFSQHMPILIATCFAVVLRLCHLIVVTLNPLFGTPIF